MEFCNNKRMRMEATRSVLFHVLSRESKTPNPIE